MTIKIEEFVNFKICDELEKIDPLKNEKGYFELSREAMFNLLGKIFLEGYEVGMNTVMEKLDGPITDLEKAIEAGP
jgi:hypothetical protein